MTDGRRQMTEGGRQMTEGGRQKTEGGRQRADDRRRKTDGFEFGSGNYLNSEVGKRPPASPSCRLYEPEAVGAIGDYAPEEIGKKVR